FLWATVATHVPVHQHCLESATSPRWLPANARPRRQSYLARASAVVATAMTLPYSHKPPSAFQALRHWPTGQSDTPPDSDRRILLPPLFCLFLPTHRWPVLV